jgi:DNA invertase Pin-like site-specific DNA recombinase
VSTDEQVEGTSLGVQLTRGRAWCELNGYEISGEYVDEGESGANASRPRFVEMLTLVRGGGIGAVVVEKLDRFGRSVEHNSALLGELDRAGVRFVSTSQEFDASTPMGRAMRHMASIFAEVERDMIRERMISGVTAVVNDGHWPGGPPPFGYRVVHDGRHADLEIDDDEAGTVRIIVECMVDQRMSTLQTARHLNSLGRKPRRLGRWSSQSLRHVANNGTGWSGVWQYRREERKGKPGRDPFGRYGPPINIAIPTILTPERHEALRGALARSSTGPVGRKNVYLLSGIIISPHGANFQGITRPGGLALMRCAQDHPQRPAEQRCDCRTIVVPVVERLVWDEVARVLSDPDQLRARAEAALAGMRAVQTGDDMAALRRKLAAAQKALGDAFASAVKLGLDSQALAHATAQLSDDVETAKVRLARAGAWARTTADTRSRVERIWALAESARRTLDTDDPSLRRRILDVLGVRVQVTGWQGCPTCHGGGLVAVEPDPITGKRPKGAAGSRVCPTCYRTRHVPLLAISGEIPDASSLDAASTHDQPGWPFTVVAGGAAS